MKRMLLLAGSIFLLHPASRSQGIIVNEISQGPAGSQEFIELLVVGSAAQPSGTVDLRDWIIDDNNGEFALGDNSTPGIANGHFRLVINDTFAAVPIGALIVIYNVADPNPAWTFRQFGTGGEDIPHIENAGFTYYIPGNSTLLRACSGTPNNTSTSYAYTASTIPPIAANWSGQIGLANNGDAIQTRKPDGTFFHGFGFSTPTIGNNFTTFPSFSEVSLPSFNGYTGVATNVVTYFDCGSYYYGNNFLSGAAATETPGAANTADNNLLINNIRAGLFQYSQLGNNVPCSVILPVDLLYFTGRLVQGVVDLSWGTASERNNARFIVQRSNDQSKWADIGTLPGKRDSEGKREYAFTDKAPLTGTSFYRLAQEDLDGAIAYSQTVMIVNSSQQEAYLYPNPVSGNEIHIHTGAATDRIVLYDILGRTSTLFAVTAQLAQELTLDISRLPKGLYYLRLYSDNGIYTLPLLRE